MAFACVEISPRLLINWASSSYVFYARLVFAALLSLACHVASAFRVMSFLRLTRAELTSTSSGIQRAVIGAGATIREWDEKLTRSLTDAISRYHPVDHWRMHSVDDTLDKALSSLQSVSTTTVGITMQFACACANTTGSRSSNAMCMSACAMVW